MKVNITEVIKTHSGEKCGIIDDLECSEFKIIV